LQDRLKVAASQTGLLELMMGLGNGFITIKAEFTAVQLKADPITEYCVLTAGLAVKVLPVVLLLQV
jgi:hypothetical protein